MLIGLAFNLKSQESSPGRPDDWQEEFDSPATIAALRRVLQSAGHTVIELGDGRALIERLLRDPVDLVFNFAEGVGIGRCREARVPAICEALNISYTGSDALALAASLDKDVARRLVATFGVPIPVGFAVTTDEQFYTDALPFPAIVKPAWEGSSKGVRGKCVVHSDAELRERVAALARDYQQPILIEEFIAGDEVTVSVLGNDPPRVLGCMQVIPKRPTSEFVYSLEVKRDWENQVNYQCPPNLDAGTLAVLEANALLAYRALGCRDIARIDFRIRNGVPYFLEANPLPGLHPETGDIVLTARAMGIGHAELVLGIVKAALARYAMR